MKTIAVRLKMNLVVACLLWILSIDVVQSTVNNASPDSGQVGVNSTAEEKTSPISSGVSYPTSYVTVTTSPPPIGLVSTSSSLSDNSVKSTAMVSSTANTPGLNPSTADPPAPQTQATTSATASERVTPESSGVETIRPTQTVTSISKYDSNLTDMSSSTATTISPQSVTLESTSVTTVVSRIAINTTYGVTSTTESKSVTLVVSHIATNSTYGVTPVGVSTSSVIKTTVQNVTLVPARESVTPVLSNETSKTTGSVTLTATTFKVTPSLTSAFIASSQGITKTPSRFTASSSTSMTGNVSSLEATTSGTAFVFPVTSNLSLNKSVTSSYTVSKATSSPTVVKTTGIASSVAISTSVPYSSTVATTTKPPTTTPITTTTPQVSPKFTKEPEDKTVKENHLLELTCQATGLPPPVITWKKDNAPLKNTSRIFISADNSTIKIHRTTREDKGMYQCNASNGVGRGVAAQATVYIEYFSDLEIIINEPGVITEGDTVQLTCSVDAYPKPMFEWRKDGAKSGESSNQYSKNSRYVSDLDLKDITREKGGNYTCTARDDNGVVVLGVASKVLHVVYSSMNKPTYPPPKVMKRTDHTIAIPIHKISYLGNGKKVSYIQVIVYKLDDQALPRREPSQFKPTELGPYSENRTVFYIAAVVMMKDVDKLGPKGLVLGDGTKYSAPTEARRRRTTRDNDEVYHNVPLLPGTYYTAFQRMLSTEEDYESLGWLPVVKTSTQTIEPIDGPNITTILLIVCGICVVLVLLIACIVAYFIKKNKSQNVDIDGTEMQSGKNNPWDKMARSLSFHMARLHEHYHPSGPILIENFAHHVTRMHKSGDMHFSTEYEKIPEYDNIPATHSIDPANQWKNRYSNIVAYDYNRVKLVPYDDEPKSDYINASYITGYSKEKTYIAAQGPLDETCGDFWRMIWEQNTRVIVMLTNVRERGRLKCSQYWPTSGKSRYEVIYVSLEDVIELTSYTMRVFRVAMAGQKETRIIKQFHFTGWPDHGVPKSATFLLAFVRQTAKVNPSDAGPMVVHCSAGVGRTGTFIVIDVMLQQIAKEKTVDILNYVTQLRKQRNLMVQTEQQYIFIHDALLDVIISGDTEIHASKLRNHVQEMIEPYKETGDTKIDLEFQRLSLGVRPHYTNTAATIPANKSKNRYANNLPYDDTRVPLAVQVAVNGSDYINANYIDAYMKKRAFIATQAPLPDTFDDFWRMIWEQKCYTIIVLAQEVENTKLKMNRYWPTTHPITFGVLQVEMLEEEKTEFLETRVFNITNTMDSSSQIVHQFHYTAWTSEDLSDSGVNLLSTIEHIQQWQNASGNHVITVHCSAGVGRTGVFCAVSSLIERLKAEAVVDVFQTVKQLREQRPAMVQTKSQYEFCYTVLLEYLDTHTSLEELDPSPVPSQSNNTGNPPPSEKDQDEFSEQDSPESPAENNKKPDLVDSASTSDTLSEAREKNHSARETVTASENLEPEDVTPQEKTKVNVTPQNEEQVKDNLDVTIENEVSLQNTAPGNVTLKNASTENITPANVKPEDDATLKENAHEDVTQQKVIQDVTAETHQKTDEDNLANHVVENSPPVILQRADSEESDPYVSPVASSLNLSGS